MRVNGYRLFYNKIPISSSDFRRKKLTPLVGERKAFQVIQGFEYMLFACGENKRSRKRLESKTDDEEDNRRLFQYEDYGVNISFTCVFFDGICTANILNCGLSVSRSP